tara:strand:- start:2725 stop:2964 length:240 start_codon:yes stop_codon:yes gene_type:complete
MECSICFEKDKWTCITPCGHNICLFCLINIENKNCPICRKDLLEKLPEKIKNVVKNNNYKKKETSGYDLYNTYDFPHLF